MWELDYYRERNPELPLDAINHKINTLAYFMFGYKATVDDKKRFLFSPLGNLFLKHLDDDSKRAKIFMTMLWAIQYDHPHDGTDSIYQLYPFRLVFNLLQEPRLGCKLYAFEVAYCVVFTKHITCEKYEELVQKLMYLRTLTNEEMSAKFSEDPHVYVNSAYEWDYYLSGLFESAGALVKTEGEEICRLQHGTALQNGKPTMRSITRNEVKISDNVKNLVSKLEAEYSYLAEPLKLNDPERMKMDVVKEVYSFYPKILLDEINEFADERKLELLNLPKLIDQFSNNTDGIEAYRFEDILVDGFNMFYNVEAQKIGGSGNTDLECLYLTEKKKFAVDAKSTKNKLLGIKSGRLQAHREKIGGEYTIVVTPRYVPAVLLDIQSSPIVILRASTFSEYLYNCIDNDIRDVDYAEFHSIITNNLGRDISKLVSNLTIEKFATEN